MDIRTRIRAAFLAAALAVATVSCGDEDSEATAEVSATEHNDADDPEVQHLAEQIRDAQAPEIDTFTAWLTDWGVGIPETMRDHTSAGDDHEDMSESMEDMDMPGMMSAEDMDALEDASDAEFQTLWLEMMIEHHEGAVEMAKDEQEDGRFEPAVELAGDIVESQSAEIETMQGLLD